MIIFVTGLYDGMRQHAKKVTIDTEVAGGAYWHPMYDPLDPVLFEDSHSTLPAGINTLVTSTCQPGSNISKWPNNASHYEGD